MLLSIIIVNYKSSHFINDCLSSADAHLISNHLIEWIVVDNASGDESEWILTAKFPFLQWINMGYNAGFARANNVGIKRARGQVILLLNPDTILLPSVIENCLNRFLVSTHVACGVQLVHPSMEPQFSGSHFMLGGINHLLPLPYWGTVLKRIAALIKTPQPSIILVGTEQPIDWISGAFLMVKKTVIEQAGLLDEDFFLYGEEVEWCSRIRKFGTICIYGDLKIIHLIGETIKEATQSDDNSYLNLYGKKGRQLIVSNHLRIRKQYGIFWFLFQLLNYTWAIIFAYFLCLFRNLFLFKNPVTEIFQISGLARNVFEVWKLTPRILLNREHFYKCI